MVLLEAFAIMLENILGLQLFEKGVILIPHLSEKCFVVRYKS